MAEFVSDHLVSQGVEIRLSQSVTSFEPLSGNGIKIRIANGGEVEAGIVILSVGVKPDTALAHEAGLALGSRGGIQVDAYMRTSDPSIWAAGDAVEVLDWMTGQPTLVPLGGPANRQGRIVAGMVAADVLRRDLPLVHWSEPDNSTTLFLDVRDREEFAEGHCPKAINIPLPELRGRLEELSKESDLRVYCAVGIRGYLATRILVHDGFRARNCSGGWRSFRQ